MKTIQDCLNERILIIDGAMGTMIQQYKLSEADYRGERFKDWQSDVKGNNDLLSITQPQIIEEIHKQYLEAGADIIETNTFNAQRVSLADYHMQELAYEINFAAAKIARAAVDKFTSNQQPATGNPKFVAGAIGPMNKKLSLSPDINNFRYIECNGFNLFNQKIFQGYKTKRITGDDQWYYHRCKWQNIERSNT